MWSDPTTEFPFLNSTEIWEMYNASPDAHPMHIHLVQFQILGRQKFTSTVLPKMNMAHDCSMSMGGKLTNINLKGKENKPGLYEAGWKDTGIMYPGERTRVIAKFERPGEYVWHCHILSHEDHEMMRRFEVVSALPKDGTGETLASVSGFVGVMDMLRYHTASANAYAWSSDYGTVEDADQFRALLAYSPVHNLKPVRCYPPTLVTTADRDDRVVTWHSFKFAAALQYAQSCANPVLIRIETRAGHGVGKPTWMLVENYANQWAFLARHLGMPGGK